MVLTSDKSEKRFSIAYRDFPEAFAHPRLVVFNPDKAADAIRPSLRAFARWTFPPKVTFTIEARLEGGVTPVDLRAIMDAFIYAGARDVNPTSAIRPVFQQFSAKAPAQVIGPP
jgi:hypothetical protein